MVFRFKSNIECTTSAFFPVVQFSLFFIRWTDMIVWDAKKVLIDTFF